MNESSLQMYEMLHRFNPDYQTNNAGLACLDMWIDKIETMQDDFPHIIEVGCGNGLLCKELAVKGFSITGTDIVAGDYDRSGYEFKQMDALTLLDEFGPNCFDVALCFDVLEHLDEKEIELVLGQIGAIAPKAIISVACYGGPPLHLTVKPPGWWFDKILIACPDSDWSIIKVFNRYENCPAVLFYADKREGEIP